jgi:O-methyltransferase
MKIIIKTVLSKALQPIFRSLGYELISSSRKNKYPMGFDPKVIEIFEAVKPFTMTSIDRISAVVAAVQYVTQNDIDGSFVECGVWRGGSSMAMIYALQRLALTNRELYMYDTYEGMSAPSEFDISASGNSAHNKFSQTKISEDSSDWCLASLEDVRKNILSTGYPAEKINFIKGKVEDTVPAQVPEKIALLRLDTDWYESTKHELIHLYPRLSQNGILIIDDYGHWQGARKAVDEYFKETGAPVFLNRIDYTGRLVIKSHNLQD